VKKFIWPLQRLLDIKVKQEDFARIELVTITEKIVIIRGQIMMQKMVLRIESIGSAAADSTTAGVYGVRPCNRH
jgi:hypothetical protein